MRCGVRSRRIRVPEERILETVERYYSGRFAEHGTTARGVDWNSVESQEIRFAQLARVCPTGQPFTLLDYGCGYGALLPFLRERGLAVDYTGFDLSAAMLEHGRACFAGEDGVRFVGSDDALEPADVVVASGIFNVRLDVDADSWHAYVLATVRRLAALSRRAFAFNCLTSYADPERMRPDLYYGDGPEFFDFTKRELAREVALLHDYGLWEWTLTAWKAPWHG
jgi:SAM-dependent methyltransferase